VVFDPSIIGGARAHRKSAPPGLVGA
jgi:hypothetical protein